MNDEDYYKSEIIEYLKLLSENHQFSYTWDCGAADSASKPYQKYKMRVLKRREESKPAEDRGACLDLLEQTLEEMRA